MGLSAAEKQRRYRQRRDQDPERRAKYLQYEKNKYVKDKASGKRKSIASMSKREARTARRKWKMEKRDLRKRKKIVKNLATPPASPQMPEVINQPTCSRQMTQSKRKRKREERKYYRENKILENKLKIAERKAEMYKKRWSRLKEKNARTPSFEDTPSTKTKKLLRNFSCKMVKKTLVFHHALVDELKTTYKNRNKKSIASILAGNILKKYGFISFARNALGIYSGKKKSKTTGSLKAKMKEKVGVFFERDDVSRITSGVKRTVTKEKVKKQLRLLCDTVGNCYRKFISENKEKISFTTFWRLKPFWVKKPTEADRETCLCKLCENTRFMSETLQKYGIIDTADLSNLVKQCVCSTKNKSCMYGECGDCTKQYVSMNHKDLNIQVKWTQWKSVREERTL